MKSAANKRDSLRVREETMEDESELELAYQDQGYHEMEFTTGHESELHKRKTMCQKNPGHVDFIPAKKFSIEHLPELHRDSLVFYLVTTVISLTVRLAVKYTSKDRPSKYPLYNRRGQYGVTAFGTGVIRTVEGKFTEKDERPCPCETCKQSPQKARLRWGMFKMMTAKHVVFDTSEARHTKCNLFFDSDEDRYNCPSLEGVEVVESDIKGDYCYMTCITHDEDVCGKLEELLDRYDDLRDQIYFKYKQTGHVDKNTAVVISHPHGLSKYVTVGDLTDRKGGLPWKYKYHAGTCPGSSGAPVCFLGKWADLCDVYGFYNVTHSGSPRKGYNESSDVWY